MEKESPSLWQRDAEAQTPPRHTEDFPSAQRPVWRRLGQRWAFIAWIALVSLVIVAPDSLTPIKLRRGKAGTLHRDDHAYPEFLTDAGRLLPPEIHATTLTTREHAEKTKRIVVVGDVHGCVDEMQELLAKVNFTQESDLLLFNGDMVNKGPHSVKVIQEVRKLGGMSVRGNNDDLALGAWEAWHRGKTELPEKVAWVKGMPKADADWLRNLPWTIHIPDLNLVMVHGGLVPDIPLHQQSLQTLFTLRELIQDKDGVWRMAQDKEGEHGPEWTSIYDGHDFVIFGHDSGRGLQRGPRSLGLDTGCVYGNVLTAAIIDLTNSTGPALGNAQFQGDLVDKIKLVSVKAHHQYAPSCMRLEYD